MPKPLQQAGRAHPRQEAAALSPCGRVKVHLCVVYQGLHLQLHAQLVILKLVPVVKEFTFHDLQWAQAMKTTQLMSLKNYRAQLTCCLTNHKCCWAHQAAKQRQSWHAEQRAYVSKVANL